MRKQKLLSILFVGCLAGSLALSPVSSVNASTDGITLQEVPAEENAVPPAAQSPSVPDSPLATAPPSATEIPLFDIELPSESDKESLFIESPSETENPQEQQMFYGDSRMAEEASSLDQYLNEDPSKPQRAITLNAKAGASLDGYQLNHDQVKVLNINTGNITINGETYTQENGETDAPWDAKTDAYVIRGTGGSSNIIYIASPITKVTIYIMNLEWSGSIRYSKNTELELIICGNIINNDYFLYDPGYNTSNLTVKGITANGNSINAKNYFMYSGNYKNVLIEDISLTANYLNIADSLSQTLQIKNSELNFSISNTNWVCNDVIIDNSKVANLGIFRSADTDISTPNMKIQNNSTVTNITLHESRYTQYKKCYSYIR